MIGRLIAGLVLGLTIFVLASVLQALLLPSSAAGEYSWLILLAVLALALFVALRAPTIRTAWGHLVLINGIFGLALGCATLLPRPLTAQEEFQPDMVSPAAARYIAHALLSQYGAFVALFLALILIASSILLLQRSKPR